MAQTKPKAAQFYGVSNNGTAGQVLISDGNGGMSWGANTEQFTVSWATPTGQSLTYTQPSPQSSQGTVGSAFPTTTFTATKSGEEISDTATIAGLPTGVTATQSISGSGANNILTVTLAGVFPGFDSLNTNLTISGLTVRVPLPPLTINYLVVAGGGGGGNGSGGGGAGAGGYRTNQGGTALTLNAATNYSLTIGAGATAIPQGTASTVHGANGNQSIFHNITATAGGGGGSENNNTGNPGGSGGGGSYNGSGGSGNAGSYSPAEGYAGGSGGTPTNYSGGGGGGASNTGNRNASGTGTAGNGGNGLSNNITGSSVTYAGGGGGGSQSGGSPGNRGTGGSGGGGNGAAYTGSAGSNGTPNTGGGGGGTAYQISGGPAQAAGYGGGSGVVILRYPAGYAISGLSGSTVTVGTDKVTTFTAGTGNVQFN